MSIENGLLQKILNQLVDIHNLLLRERRDRLEAEFLSGLGIQSHDSVFLEGLQVPPELEDSALVQAELSRLKGMARRS